MYFEIQDHCWMQDKEKDFTLYSNLLIQCYGIEVCGTMWIPNTIVRQSMGKNYDHNNKKKFGFSLC